jgi:hypothetical protein
MIFYFALGFSPAVEMPDNETGKELKLFFRKLKIKHEFVPPNNHRRLEETFHRWSLHSRPRF